MRLAGEIKREARELDLSWTSTRVSRARGRAQDHGAEQHPQRGVPSRARARVRGDGKNAKTNPEEGQSSLGVGPHMRLAGEIKREARELDLSWTSTRRWRGAMVDEFLLTRG